MSYLSVLLGVIVFLLLMIGWTLDGIRHQLKSINSKLEDVNSAEGNIEENVDLLLKLKTGQVRFNGEHFEDV